MSMCSRKHCSTAIVPERLLTFHFRVTICIVSNSQPSYNEPYFKDYGILMLGRLLGGVSTSLLFSVFESWLIRAHADAELPKQCLAKSFSWAAFGNSVVAITAGLIANNIAHAGPMTPVTDLIYKGGYLNPFDLALVALLFCGFGARFLWEENYGDADTNGEQSNGKGRVKWYDGLRNAWTTTVRNRDIFLCGIISSLFEGSMYIFVFMWTPLLKSFLKAGDDDLPFGLIFATFMVCCMTGSSLFSILVEKFPVEKLAVVIFAVGAVAMAIVAMEINETMSFLGMNLFEITVGMYFPIMGTMKGGIVPEDKRAAIYNLYRIPLNFIVLFSLLTDLTPSISFTLNACMLGVATLAQSVLTKRRLETTGQMKDTNDSIPLLEPKGSEDVDAPPPV
ncbi:sugar transporter [Nitzschia inconspicua]|uniref:Sugar transporter n=1 Tax=Nitzschia inconspicua TaxID=303405 RepID=A0A9K3LNT5_9STRA|nr:sugar transporter [Nitzschia inconspicua]